MSSMSLIAAGRKALARKGEGFSATTLREAGYLAGSLRYAGYSLQELKRAGFSKKELQEAGFSPRAITPRTFGGCAPHALGAHEVFETPANEASHGGASIQDSEAIKAMRAWQRKIEKQLAAATATIKKQSEEITALKHRVAPTLTRDGDVLGPDADVNHRRPPSLVANQPQDAIHSAHASMQVQAEADGVFSAKVNAEVTSDHAQNSAAALIQIRYKQRIESSAERPSRYFGVDALLESIESAAVAPLRGRYLVAAFKDGRRVERRQDMPPEAFWSAEELKGLFQKLKALPTLNTKQAERRFLTLFHAFSGPELADGHCDPDRHHLETISKVARARLQKLTDDTPGAPNSPHNAVFVPLGVPEDTDCAIFWAFCSLHQPRSHGDDRTVEQRRLFAAGQRATDVWFGHEKTSVWLQTLLPANYDGPPFEQCGQCACDLWMSTLVSKADSAGCLDLGQVCNEPTFGTMTYTDLKKKSLMRPRPPLAAGEVAGRLPALRFTSDFDREVRFEIYQLLSASVFSSRRQLLFTPKALKLQPGEHWSISEFGTLTRALPHFNSCQLLDFERHQMGNEACKMLAKALADKVCMPVLETLRMCNCKVGDLGGQAIANAVRKRGKTAIKLLELHGNHMLRSAAVKMELRFVGAKALMEITGVEYEP